MNHFDPCYRFPRDSRHVYGVRFQVEKPSRDWIWGAAIALVSVCSLVLLGNM